MHLRDSVLLKLHHNSKGTKFKDVNHVKLFFSLQPRNISKSKYVYKCRLFQTSKTFGLWCRIGNHTTFY